MTEFITYTGSCDFCGEERELMIGSTYDSAVICPACAEGAVQFLSCRKDDCSNKALYSSGFCGVHDITENNGKGSGA